MSYKTGHKDKAYEFLRISNNCVPFNFSEWQMDKTYEPLRAKLREQKYTVKDTKIPYRVINHWELKNLMPEGVLIGDRQDEVSWRKFSLVEMAWLKVVEHLRKFGFSLKQIAKVKEDIIHWNKTYNYYPSFEFCLAQSLFGSKDTYIAIFADGYAKAVAGEELEMANILGNYKDMLLVSIKSVLAELGLTFSEVKSRLELSDEEFELFDEIRNGGHSEIKAGLKAGKITEIETSKTTTEPVLDSDIRKQAEQEGMYGRVLTQYEKGKRRSVQIIKRKKFSAK